MCGILGSILNKTPVDKIRFEDALKLLIHRGPDSLNSNYMSVGDFKVSLGHTRLKIIDLSDNANQPMTINNITIVFNGEIYNYKAIRNELVSLGVRFNTDSDTEVILRAYMQYGIKKMLNMLSGMYAFFIIDASNSVAYLVRDRAGIKPLYYYIVDGELYFSSEIKAIKKLVKEDLAISKKSIYSYFHYRYVPEPETIYEDVYMLDGGEFIEISLSKNFTYNKKKYWTLNYDNVDRSEQEIINHVEELLHKSVEEHLVSDVPVCFAFSGGLDSSILLSIAKDYKSDIEAYSIKREDDETDYVYSRKIAKHLGIKQKIIDYKLFKQTLAKKDIFEYYDVPIACSSIYSTYLLFGEIANEYRVAISGDGGDEVFGGYRWYKRYLNLYDLKHLKLYKFLGNAPGFKGAIYDFKTFRKEKDDAAIYKKMMLNRYDTNEINNLLNETYDYNELEALTRYSGELRNIKDLMYLDFHTYLKYALLRADLSSMASSVENRVPFLNHQLVEYAYSISPDILYKNGELKYILKKVAEKYLPKEFIYRPKKGFSAPVHDFLDVKNGQEFMQYIYSRWYELNC